MAPMNPQQRCSLCNLPAEIRHNIYSLLNLTEVHLSSHKGKLAYTPCIEPNAKAAKVLDGSERRPEGPTLLETTTKYDQRLGSTWGPHWQCEELARDGDIISSWSGGLLLALTCQKIRFDVFDFIAQMATVHITDLGTFSTMLSKGPTMPRAFQLTINTFACIRKLEITLRLSVEIWKSIELSPEGAKPDHTVLGSMSFPTVWCELSLLEPLRTLDVWIDHDDARRWIVINERKIISCIEPYFNPSKVTLSFYLPYLHPIYESPDRHFTPNSDPPAIAIHRRVRQRCHPTCSTTTAEHEIDFPVLYQHGLRWGDLTLEEVVNFERSEWEGGENPEKDLYHIMWEEVE